MLYRPCVFCAGTRGIRRDGCSVKSMSVEGQRQHPGEEVCRQRQVGLKVRAHTALVVYLRLKVHYIFPGSVFFV